MSDLPHAAAQPAATREDASSPRSVKTTTHTSHDAATRTGRPRRGPLGLLIAFLLLLITGGAVVVIFQLPGQEEALPPVKAVPINVKVWRVEAEATLADTLDITGVVEPEAVVRVAAEVPGRIERYALRDPDLAEADGELITGPVIDEGEPVVAGQPLVQLNDELLRAAYERAAAQFDYEEREFRRIQDLFERNRASQTELDDARTRRDIAKAALDEAARQLERTVIRAPRGGVLNRLPMEPGEYATPGDMVAEIVCTDVVQVVVFVPEKDVYYLAPGDQAEVFTLSPDERRLVGEITYISALAEERTRTTRVEITVDNADRALRSGQIVKARLTRQMLHDVIMAPLAAVIPLEVGRVVYVVDDKKTAQRREVALGLIKGRRVQVLDGLAVGDRLIVAGHRYVGPGQPVTVIETVALD